MAADGGNGGGRRDDGREGRGGGRAGGPGGGRPPGGRGRPGGNGAGQPTPLELAARSTRNALTKHAETVRDDQMRLACRGVLSAVLAVTRDASNPAELLAVVEQVTHVAVSSRPDGSQLPATLRATVTYATEDVKRGREVVEMLRLVLRHGYAVAADHLPRQARDDAGFRTSSLRDVLADVAKQYLDDASFERAAR